MERRDEEPALAREHGVTVDFGEHLDVGAGLLEPRRADEDGAQRLVAVADVEVGLEAVHLAAERVALGAVVAEAEVVAVEDDHPGARPEDRAVELAHRVVEVVEAHEPRDRGRLAAGDDEAVEPVELLGKPNLDRLRAEPPQHGGVLAEVPLHGEDADPERLLHASMVTSAIGGRCGARRRRRRASRPRLRLPSMPSRTSQKPRRPNASAGAHGLIEGPCDDALAGRVARDPSSRR